MGPSIQIQHQMVDYDETMKKIYKNIKKMTNFEFLFGIFLLIQGGQGAIREGPEPIPELKKCEKMRFSKIGSDPPKSHHILGIQSSI